MSGILLSDGAPLEADAIWGCTDLLKEKIPDATVCVCVCVCVCVYVYVRAFHPVHPTL